ncbi:MAG: ankyrin repeat domain-containing protein [Termitinemataceae bacterium]|nr:MAG: ankyrin repeat domain-containing protein [Termitinemataceae bacterium]
MKLLIIYDDKSKENAQKLFDALHKEKNASINASMIEIFYIPKKIKDADVFFETLHCATHFVAFYSEMSDSFFYAAGVAAEGKKQFFCFSTENTKMNPFFFKKTKVYNNFDEILELCKKQLDEYPKKEAIKKAKAELLKQGVAVTKESFISAVQTGNIEWCQLFLNADFSVNTQDIKGVPLLCLAARAAKIESIEFLLKNNSDVNLCSADRGNTAIVDAALGKQSGIIALLLAHNANPNIKNKDGQTALIISVGLSDAAAVGYLLKAGADVDSTDSLGVSARKYAAMFKNETILALLEKYKK